MNEIIQRMIGSTDDQYKGCLVGGAVGDALGYAVEFMQYEDIIKKYGKEGITEYDIKEGNAAKISDDTQMTYFTGYALRFEPEINDLMKDLIYQQYLVWLKGQLEGYDKNTGLNPILFERRAPGNTCIESLLSNEIGSLDNKINNSKGSGGIMRVAPVGFLLSERNEVERFGAEVAAITHTHELGYIPAAFVAGLIHEIMHGKEGKSLTLMVLEVLEDIKKIFKNSKYLMDIEEIVSAAIKLYRSDYSDVEAIKLLGEGWVAEEALGIALFCSLRYKDDFEKGIIAAVNHNGDSDTTGAITGNILGAYLGLKKIPKKFIDKLELEKDLEKLGEDLYLSAYTKYASACRIGGIFD